MQQKSAHKDRCSQQEIDAFDALASDWWDPNGSMRPLHQLNPVRMAYIESHCSLKHIDVLDLGCGGGILSESMARSGANVTGIDLSSSLIDCAQQHAQERHLDISYHNHGIAQQQQSTQRFPLITCLEMLEHVEHPDQILAHCAECLSAEGTLIVSTLNRHPKAFLFGIIAAEYVLKLLPKGTHQYQQFIRPSELKRWANAAGLTLVDLRGIQYQLLSNSFVLSNNVDINYLATFKKKVA